MTWAFRHLIQSCCIVAALFAANEARADFAAAQHVDARNALVQSAPGAADAMPLAAASQSAWSLVPIERLTSLASEPILPNTAASHAEAKSERRNVIMVPAGPSSVSLFFSALAGFGVLHLGKNVRKLNFSALPEWYQADGPAQIGRATPLDPDFHLSTLSLCVFEGPARFNIDENRGVSFERLRFERVRIPHRDFTPLADPRGPPSLH